MGKKKKKKDEPIMVVVLLDNLQVEYVSSLHIDRYLDDKRVAYFLIPVSVSSMSVYVPVKRKRLKRLYTDFHKCTLKYSYIFKRLEELDDPIIVKDNIIVDLEFTDPIQLIITLHSLKRLYAINLSINASIYEYSSHIDIGLFEMIIYNKEGTILQSINFKDTQNYSDEEPFVLVVNIMSIISKLEFMNNDFQKEFSDVECVIGIDSRDSSWGIYRRLADGCNIQGIYNRITESIYFMGSAEFDILSSIHSMNVTTYVIEFNNKIPLDFRELLNEDISVDYIEDHEGLLHDSYEVLSIYNAIHLFELYNFISIWVDIFFKRMYNAYDSNFYTHIITDVHLKNTSEFTYIFKKDSNLNDFMSRIMVNYV